MYVCVYIYAENLFKKIAGSNAESKNNNNRKRENNSNANSKANNNKKRNKQ